MIDRGFTEKRVSRINTGIGFEGNHAFDTGKPERLAR